MMTWADLLSNKSHQSRLICPCTCSITASLKWINITSINIITNPWLAFSWLGLGGLSEGTGRVQKLESRKFPLKS